MGVEKVLQQNALSSASMRLPVCFVCVRLSGGRKNRCCGRTEEAHQSLEILRYCCQVELFPHKLQSSQTQAPQSDPIFQFREQGFHLLSLPLCFGELWRVDQLPRTLPGGFILVDDQPPEGSTGALRSQRARATLFAAPDVVEGAIPINASSIIEHLAGGTEIAIVFGLVSETLGTEERTPLSVNTVTGPHVGRDAAIRHPLQELSVPVGRVSYHRLRRSPLPLGETGQHILCGYCLLTHACRGRLHAHNHATIVVHQIVVVVTEARRCAALGSVGGIGIGRRHLIL